VAPEPAITKHARCSGRSVRRSANRPSATGVQTWGNGGVAEAAQNVLHPFGGRPSALPAALRRGSRIAYPGLTCTIRPTPDATPALRQAASRRLPASRTATAAAREGRSLPPVRRRETVRAPPVICGLCRALPGLPPASSSICSVSVARADRIGDERACGGYFRLSRFAAAGRQRGALGGDGSRRACAGPRARDPRRR
jgi:hypothetical protein